MKKTILFLAALTSALNMYSQKTNLVNENFEEPFPNAMLIQCGVLSWNSSVSQAPRHHSYKITQYNNEFGPYEKFDLCYVFSPKFYPNHSFKSFEANYTFKITDVTNILDNENDTLTVKRKKIVNSNSSFFLDSIIINERVKFLNVNDYEYSNVDSLLTINSKLFTKTDLDRYTFLDGKVDVDFSLGSENANDPFVVINNYCDKKHMENITNYMCKTTYYAVIENKTSFITMNHVTINANSELLGIDDASTNEKNIIAVYDLFGKSVELNTKNQILIVKYSDGSFDKIFND